MCFICFELFSPFLCECVINAFIWQIFNSALLHFESSKWHLYFSAALPLIFCVVFSYFSVEIHWFTFIWLIYILFLSVYQSRALSLLFLMARAVIWTLLIKFDCNLWPVWLISPFALFFVNYSYFPSYWLSVCFTHLLSSMHNIINSHQEKPLFHWVYVCAWM